MSGQGNSKGSQARTVFVYEVLTQARYDKMRADLERLDQDVAEAAGEKAKRLRLKLEAIEPDDIIDTDIVAIGVVALTANEEVMAAKGIRAETMMSISGQLAKKALVEIHRGDVVAPKIEKVSMGDFTVDRAWTDMDPKVRQLVLNAYADVHNPTERATKSFLGSRSVRTG